MSSSFGKISLLSSTDLVIRTKNIAEAWQKHYRDVFSCVNGQMIISSIIFMMIYCLVNLNKCFCYT